MRQSMCVAMLSLVVIAIGPRAARAAAEVLPAGTTLNILTAQPIEADDVQVGVVRVERSSNMKGRDRITLTINALHVGDRTYPVETHLHFRLNAATVIEP